MGIKLPESGLDQVALDGSNASFWDELCGSHLARSLGVVDSSPASLKLFDDWYFSIYPYLAKHIPFEGLNDRDVLEVGLGYGTVSQRLAESGARYTGLDIARGPVAMANQRLRQNNLPGEAREGSILAAPFSDGSFDVVVAIGCLHHTGDLARAIASCHRILRPGGQLIFMVYYAYSYRRFMQARDETIGYWLRETGGYRGVVGRSGAGERAAYDSNAAGESAPHTDWISRRSHRRFCKDFSRFEAALENIDREPPFANRSREELLKTVWPRWMGLDLYAVATK